MKVKQYKPLKLTWRTLQLSLTYFPAELSSSHTKWLPLKNFVLVRRISLKESQIQHNWTMIDQKVIVCRKSKELIIFSAICVATALFVMIGYFTFLSPEKKETPVEKLGVELGRGGQLYYLSIFGPSGTGRWILWWRGQYSRMPLWFRRLLLLWQWSNFVSRLLLLRLSIVLQEPHELHHRNSRHS